MNCKTSKFSVLKKIVFLLLITTISVFLQTIEGVVIDSITKKKIAFSSIVLLNGRGIYTDDNGTFSLKSKKNNDTLKISTIGYHSKLIPLKPYESQEKINLKIYLQPKVEQLSEVLINSKKLKFNKKVTFGEKRDGNIGMSSLIGYETCILIKNPKRKLGRVKRVYINLKRRHDAQLNAAFSIKLYKYDKINNKPGDLLNEERILVYPKNKKYRLWVNLKDLKIDFPENGICIGVEMINTHGKVKKYTTFGPMYRYTKSESNDFTIWSNYYNVGWKSGSTKNKKRKTLNPMIGLEVLYADEN